jgi:hypothetical protein
VPHPHMRGPHPGNMGAFDTVFNFDDKPNKLVMNCKGCVSTEIVTIGF